MCPGHLRVEFIAAWILLLRHRGIPLQGTGHDLDVASMVRVAADWLDIDVAAVHEQLIAAS